MIHIHGTPTGGTRDGSVKFITGRDVLVSFAYQDDLKRAQEYSNSYVLDNGAFTTWRQGKEFDVHGYIDWVLAQSDQPKLKWALIPDVIDGDESANDDLITLWLRVGIPVLGVPIWHYHESIDRLVFLAENFSLIALGSSGEYPTPGTNKWWSRTAEAMNAICDADGIPITNIHGLRMLDPRIFTHLPFYSADSTNAVQNGSRKAKQIGVPHSWQGSSVIAWQIEQHDSAEKWGQQELQMSII